MNESRIMILRVIAIPVGLILCVLIPVNAQSRRVIPDCEASSGGSTVGWSLRLSVPNDAVVQHVHDGDHVRYSVAFSSESNAPELTGFSGLQVGDGNVPGYWVKKSASFSRRAWLRTSQGHRIKGVDAKGKLRNGNYWRYLGMFGEVILYDDAPASVATYFDRLLDNVCWVDPK